MLRFSPLLSEFRPLFNNKKLKKIVNVYQFQTKNQRSVCGIGDYYRGCFMLYYICRLLNLEFDINIKNHPISKFIVTSRHEDRGINYNTVIYMLDYNDINVYMKKLMEYLNNCNNEICYIMTNLRYDEFNVTNPMYNVVQSLTPFIRNKIKPNDELTAAVEERLSTLKLNKKNYGIIHLRCGDNFMLLNDKFDPSKKDQHSMLNNDYFNKIVSIIKQSVNMSNKYLIIGDNNSVKTELNKIFPNFISTKSDIVHLGQSIEHPDNAVKETMIDFYLMALSRHILSFTVYGHGSGFSKWCAVMYGVRFSQHYLLDSHIPTHLIKMGFLIKK